MPIGQSQEVLTDSDEHNLKHESFGVRLNSLSHNHIDGKIDCLTEENDIYTVLEEHNFSLRTKGKSHKPFKRSHSFQDMQSCRSVINVKFSQ